LVDVALTYDQMHTLEELDGPLDLFISCPLAG
jgi:hypothetical protein